MVLNSMIGFLKIHEWNNSMHQHLFGSKAARDSQAGRRNYGLDKASISEDWARHGMRRASTFIEEAKQFTGMLHVALH